MNSDERDLIAYAERAGFRDIHLDLEVDIKPLSEIPGWNLTWESFMRSAENSKIPTLEEATRKLSPKTRRRGMPGQAIGRHRALLAGRDGPASSVLRRRFERAMRAIQAGTGAHHHRATMLASVGLWMDLVPSDFLAATRGCAPASRR